MEKWDGCRLVQLKLVKKERGPGEYLRIESINISSKSALNNLRFIGGGLYCIITSYR